MAGVILVVGDVYLNSYEECVFCCSGGVHTFLWEGLEADIRIFMRILLALESRVVYSILNDKFYEI